MSFFWSNFFSVATTPTVYGIETELFCTTNTFFNYVATTPTVYGIETQIRYQDSYH